MKSFPSLESHNRQLETRQINQRPSMSWVPCANPETSLLVIASCRESKRETCLRFLTPELTEWHSHRITTRVRALQKFWSAESRPRSSGDERTRVPYTRPRSNRRRCFAPELIVLPT